MEVDSMKQSQRIVKNALFGITSSVIGGLVYFATILIIARAVSVTEFGEYSFVLAFAMFVNNIADSGLPRMLVREISRDPEQLVRLVGAGASLIWVISGVMCLLVAVIIPFLHVGTDVKMSVLGMSIATMATFHAAGYSAALRAFEDNELNYLGFVLHKLLLLGLVFAVVKLHFGLLGFVAAHLASNLLAWSKPILRIALGQKYLPAIPAMQLLGIGIIPFFLSTLFQYLFAALDQQKRFLASTCVGSALRLLLLVALIPLLGFVGPAAAFLCAETVVVTIWMVQLARLGVRAKLSDVIWRSLSAVTPLVYSCRCWQTSDSSPMFLSSHTE